MRKIQGLEHISLDGVIQAPGGRNEDGDYAYGGWTTPYRSPAGLEAVIEATGKELRSAAGPPHVRYLGGPLAEGGTVRSRTVLRRTKYVATHKAEKARGGGQGSGCDIIEGVRGVKSKDGLT